MKISKNKIATLGYTLKNDNEQILDQADKDNPFLYMHGTGGIIKGLENALEDKTIDDSFNLIVAPEDAYGERDDNLTEAVPRSMFEGIDEAELKAGAQFHAQTAEGTQIISIASVEGDTIKIDANHPLAGETLHFIDVTVLDIRDATAAEIEHGHPHASEVVEEAGSCCDNNNEKSDGGCCG